MSTSRQHLIALLELCRSRIVSYPALKVQLIADITMLEEYELNMLKAIITLGSAEEGEG